MIHYFWLPCRTSLSQEKLIYLIETIGKYYQNRIYLRNNLIFQKDEYKFKKMGIELVFNRLSIKQKTSKNLKINKHKISKSQIKSFLYPSKYFDHIKIPYNSFLIFECILEIILENPKLIKKCREQSAPNALSTHCLCRNNLILDYFNLLNSHRRRIINYDQHLILNNFRSIGNINCNG